MKFTVERAALQRALAHIQGVAEKRNTIPILANVLLEHKGEGLRLTATDMEIAIVEEITSQATQTGAVTVSAGVLFDVVKRTPSSLLEFEQKDATGPLILRAGSFNVNLVVLPVDDFPHMVAEELPHNFEIKTKTLRHLIDRSKFAMSTEETRYYLNGIYLHASTEEAPSLRAVATDGHRLAQVEAELPEGAAKMPGIIIPRKTVNELRKLLENDDDNVQISLSDTRIQFHIGSVLLTSKLVDGTFPEYERVIPKNNPYLLKVTRQSLADAVGRVSAISQDRVRPIRMKISKNAVLLTSESSDQGAAHEELNDNHVTYGSEPLEIGFQARYLTDILDQINVEAEILLHSSSSPTLIRDTEQPNALYVLMPLRV